MKKLLMAAMVAGSMVAMAEEAAAPAADAPAAVKQETKTMGRAKLTPEQIAARRAKFEKRMAERKAAQEAKAVEIIKKYGLDDEKAKALFNELQEAMTAARRPRPNFPKKPAAEKKAE